MGIQLGKPNPFMGGFYSHLKGPDETQLRHRDPCRVHGPAQSRAGQAERRGRLCGRQPAGRPAPPRLLHRAQPDHAGHGRLRPRQHTAVGGRHQGPGHSSGLFHPEARSGAPAPAGHLPHRPRDAARGIPTLRPDGGPDARPHHASVRQDHL